MQNATSDLFNRIIAKLPSYACDRHQLPDWAENMARHKFAKEEDRTAHFGQYLGTYLGKSAQHHVFFFTKSLAFIDAKLQFPVYLRYVDIAQRQFPEHGSGKTAIRLTDTRDITSTLEVCPISESTLDVFEVARFLSRV
jgi:hypothetical protein